MAGQDDSPERVPSVIAARVATAAILAGLLFFTLSPGVILTVGCPNTLAMPLLCPPTKPPCATSYYVHTIVFGAVVAGLTRFAYAAKSAQDTKEE